MIAVTKAVSELVEGMVLMDGRVWARGGTSSLYGSDTLSQDLILYILRCYWSPRVSVEQPAKDARVWWV